MSIRNFSRYFTTSSRARDAGGGTFTSLRDDRPEWLQDAVYQAHQDRLPCDWVYAECRSAVQAWDEGLLVSDGDGFSEHADSSVDVYTGRLYGWASDFRLSDLFANAESEAFDLLSPEADTDKRLAVIQYCAIEAIARTMAAACDAADEEMTEAEDADPTGWTAAANRCHAGGCENLRKIR